MDVRQLRYFVRVVDLKSFSRAAEVLHVAQPALGMQIRKLEDELSTQLLWRHSRGVDPTPAGKLLWDHANTILQQVEEAKLAIRDLSGPPRRVVRIATTPTIHPRIPVDLLRRSAVDLPSIQIEIQEANTATLLDWIRTERVDLGLLYLSDERPSDVSIEDLAHEAAVFVQAPAPEREPASITLAELSRNRLVMPAYPHHLRRLLHASADREGIELRIAYEISAIGTILELVECGVACSVLPAGAVARLAETGRVVARTIIEPELSVTLSLVRSSRRALSKAHGLVRTLLTELASGKRPGQSGPAEAAGGRPGVDSVLTRRSPSPRARQFWCATGPDGPSASAIALTCRAHPPAANSIVLCLVCSNPYLGPPWTRTSMPPFWSGPSDAHRQAHQPRQPPHPNGEATRSRSRSGRSGCPTWRSIPARATGACTTASSTSSATQAPRCCCAA